MSVARKSDRGDWECWLQVTVDGKKVRRHLRGATRKEVLSKSEKLREKLTGLSMADGGSVTIAEWMDEWVAEKRTAGVRPNTLIGYRTDRKHLAAIENIRLDRLTPERISRLWRELLDSGLSNGSVRHVRRTLSAALRVAVDRGRIDRNPCKLAVTPADKTPEVEPLTKQEVQAILAALPGTRRAARWIVGLALGLRQGEVLGLVWSDIDLDDATMQVRKAMERPLYRHGCEESSPCGRKHAGHCPQRINEAGLGDLKTRASRRSVALPGPVVDALRAHRREQAKARLAAGDLWADGNFVFTNETGEPVHHHTDWSDFKQLLLDAGIERRVRPHDLRHTAATTALVSGVDSRVLQGIFGWSSPVLVARYAHVVDEAKRQAADRMGAALWPEKGTG